MEERYEIEPNVFYGRRGQDLLNDRYEYISYKRGNDELVVELGEKCEQLETSYDEHTQLSIYTIKEKKGVLNKIRKKMNKEPHKDKEEVCPSITVNRSIDGFIKLEDKSLFIKQEDIRKFVEKTCQLIVEKGRPARKEYMRQQDEARKAEYKAKEEALSKERQQKDLVAAKKINDFMSDYK